MQTRRERRGHQTSIQVYGQNWTYAILRGKECSGPLFLWGTENFTVTGGTAPCLPPAPGIRICTPAPNSTVQSPVEVAAGPVPTAERITAVRVYVDSVAVYTSVNNSSQNSYAIDAGLTMSTGWHHLVVVAYQNDGSALVGDETITVQ